MIGLSKYRAKTLKKDCPHSIRCIGRVTSWRHGKIHERYITILTIYGDGSIRCRANTAMTKMVSVRPSMSLTILQITTIASMLAQMKKFLSMIIINSAVDTSGNMRRR